MTWILFAGLALAAESPVQEVNTYTEARGLCLSAPVLAEMDIRVEPVAARAVAVTGSETGRVIQGGVRATVLVMPVATPLAGWSPGAAVAVDGVAARVRGARSGEVIVEVTGAGRSRVAGEFVTVRSPVRTLRGVVLPEASLVDRGSGLFAYVRNEDALKRVPVKAGARAGGFVQIVDGLYEGDEVAVGDVAALWIAELRAVTAGGRCCPL